MTLEVVATDLSKSVSTESSSERIDGQAQFELSDGRTLGLKISGNFRVSKAGNDMFAIVSNKVLDNVTGREYQIRGYLMCPVKPSV
jgi:hypothetical protein